MLIHVNNHTIKKRPVLNLQIEDCEYLFIFLKLLSQDKNNWTMVLNCIQHIQTRVTEIDSNHIQHHSIIHPDWVTATIPLFKLANSEIPVRHVSTFTQTKHHSHVGSKTGEHQSGVIIVGENTSILLTIQNLISYPIVLNRGTWELL